MVPGLVPGIQVCKSPGSLGQTWDQAKSLKFILIDSNFWLSPVLRPPVTLVFPQSFRRIFSFFKQVFFEEHPPGLPRGTEDVVARESLDESGNQGKSWMASYLSTIGAFIVTNGKMADIAHAYNHEKIVIFDLARTQADKLDHVYQLMESFKNGRIFSPKYESVVKTFSPCHVIAFANFIPDHSKLSQDRWLVKTL